MKIRAGYQTVTGNYRDNNEDCVLCDPSAGIFIVADGMGGQLAGEQASKLAVDIIPERVKARTHTGLAQGRELAEIIRQAVLDANQQIIEQAARRSEFQSMGTTVVMAVVHGAAAYVAGIGDSRAYLIHSNKIQQLTTDHSLAQALVDLGTISAKDARDHRFRNILHKYLGSKEVGTGPDIKEIAPTAGDRVVLASDGLTGAVTDQDILNLVSSEPDPQRAAERLVAQALDNDSRDNVSCVAVYFE